MGHDDKRACVQNSKLLPTERRGIINRIQAAKIPLTESTSNLKKCLAWTRELPPTTAQGLSKGGQRTAASPKTEDGPPVTRGTVAGRGARLQLHIPYTLHVTYLCRNSVTQSFGDEMQIAIF